MPPYQKSKLFFGRNRKSPGRFAIIPKRPGPDMKKADRISRIISLKTVCCFQYFVVSVGGVPPKSVKKFFDPRLELFSNRCLRKFESYMIGKTGVWYLRKNLVLFGPPDMQKTQEFPGFFGVVSFLLYPSGGRCRTRTCDLPHVKRMLYQLS